MKNLLINFLLLIFFLSENSYAMVSVFQVSEIMDFKWQGVAVNYVDSFIEQLKHTRWEYDSLTGKLLMIGTRSTVTEKLGGVLSPQANGTYVLAGADNYANFVGQIRTDTNSSFYAVLDLATARVVVLYKSSAITTYSFQGRPYVTKYGPYQYTATVKIDRL